MLAGHSSRPPRRRRPAALLRARYHFDFPELDRAVGQVRAILAPFHCVFVARCLDHEEAADDVLGFRVGAIGDAQIRPLAGHDSGGAILELLAACEPSGGRGLLPPRLVPADDRLNLVGAQILTKNRALVKKQYVVVHHLYPFREALAPSHRINGWTWQLSTRLEKIE